MTAKFDRCSQKSTWVRVCYHGAWILAIMSFLSSHGPKTRLLAVGGIHVFEAQASCKLISAQPKDALRNLAWADALALEALKEGNAEVTCDDETIKLDIIEPVRLDIKVVDGDPREVQKTFKVQALLYDSQGRELEIGKFTVLNWRPSKELEVANDKSAGEFGLC